MRIVVHCLSQPLCFQITKLTAVCVAFDLLPAVCATLQGPDSGFTLAAARAAGKRPALLRPQGELDITATEVGLNLLGQ
jgi:hypothetical protein